MIIIETLNIYIYACFCRYSFNNRKWESEKINNHPKWYYLFTLLSGFRDRNGTPLQYSCLENAMDGEAWWAAVHGVTESRMRLSDFTFTFKLWRRKWQPTPAFLPGKSQGRGSLVGCCLWGRRVAHDWSDLAAAAAVRVKTQILGFPSSSFLCQVTMLGTMMGLICVGLEDSQILTSPAIPLHVVLKGNVLVTDKAKLQH